MRSMFRLLAVAVLWLCAAATAPALAEKRVALVIGNAGYSSVAALSNPINDATAIGDALERLGFSVRRQSDLTFDSMRKTLNEFAREANGADIAIIYYAGHGMELAGQNYLIPVDAKLATDLDVPYEAISLNLTLGALDGARGTRLLILDACRDNPFKASMKVADASRSIGRGLARIEPSVGTIVAYAAKEGTTADDGNGEHSPFASALLEHIEEPGIDVQFLFRKVRDTVIEETGGKQEPFTYGSLPGRAVPLSPAAPEAPPPAAERTTVPGEQEIAAEVAFWNTIKDSGDRDLLTSYLKQYPNGRFVSLAEIFIARLDSEKAPPAAEAAPADNAALTDPAAPPPGPAAVEGANAPVGDLAALTPPAATVETEGPPKPDRDLIRSVQEELSRLGCYAGKSDGVWGRKSRSAVTAFADHAKLTLASLEPSEELLASLQGHGERVCPLVCGARYEVSGDRCILKTCPGGERLNSSGRCVPVEAKREAPPKPLAKIKDKAKAKAKSGCQVETEQQCIGRLSSLGLKTTGLDDLQIAARCSNPARRICR